jgi:hypothetical protein
MRSRRYAGICGVIVVLGLLTTLLATPIVRASHSQISATASRPGTSVGVWKSASGTPFKRPYSIVGGGGGGCPNGTYNYNPPTWDCMEVVYDLGAEPAWIRYGQSGASGFGFLHFNTDHGLDLGPVEAVIELNDGYYQGSPSRYEYVEAHYNGWLIDQYVVVIVQRVVGNGSPDSYPMGVVTAFCQNASGANETLCPAWVNAEL